MSLTTATISGPLTNLDGQVISSLAQIVLTPPTGVILDAPGVRFGKFILNYPDQTAAVTIPVGTYEVTVTPRSGGVRLFTRIHGYTTLTADTTWSAVIAGLVSNVDIPANTVATLLAAIADLQAQINALGGGGSSGLVLDPDGLYSVGALTPDPDGLYLPGSLVADSDGLYLIGA